MIQKRIQFAIRYTLLSIFERNKLSKIPGTHLLLNIGCAKVPKAGWINIDLNPCKGVYFADVSRMIPLKDGTVRHIHCEHLLEHLEHLDYWNYKEAQNFLKECLRVLEEGGSLRLIVPDAEKYLRAYCQNDSAFFETLRNLGKSGPFRTRMEIINQVFRMGGDHKYAWDIETLSMVLKEVGFTRVEKSQLGDIDPDLNIDLTDSWRYLESLYVNVYK
jgi:predicted SAM-dependent methyltransferase